MEAGARSGPLRLVLFTQDEPVFLRAELEHLLARWPDGVEIVGLVSPGASTGGRESSLIQETIRFLRVFGPLATIGAIVRNLGGRLTRPAPVDSVRRVAPAVTILRDDDSLAAAISELVPDIGLSITYPRLLSREVIELFPLGILNLHCSLLPRHRGVMPSFWALKEGDEKTGATVFQIDEGVDTGPILLQEEVPIVERTQASVIRSTKAKGMELVLEALALARSGVLSVRPQDATAEPYRRYPSTDDGAAFRRAGNSVF